MIKNIYDNVIYTSIILTVSCYNETQLFFILNIITKHFNEIKQHFLFYFLVGKFPTNTHEAVVTRIKLYPCDCCSFNDKHLYNARNFHFCTFYTLLRNKLTFYKIHRLYLMNYISLTVIFYSIFFHELKFSYFNKNHKKWNRAEGPALKKYLISKLSKKILKYIKIFNIN